jgi:hypothetical protein
MGIAFIVDGQQEKKVVQRLCTDVPVRVTNLNGKDVELSVIAKTVASLIKLLRGRHFPVFVIVDREGRNESSEQIELFLKNELITNYEVDVEVNIATPDRMLENWIIAGNPMCEDNRLLQENPPPLADGSNGKVFLKKMLNDKNKSYYETGNGVDLFCTIDMDGAAARDMDGAAARSPIFARFYRKIVLYCPRLRFAHMEAVSC